MYPSSLPNIDLQVLPTFPAHVGVTGVLTLAKSGLTYTFGLNFQNVAEETNVSDMSKRELLAQDTDTGAFWRIKLSNLPTGQTDWANIQNKPTEFPPSPHTHPVSQISDATPLGQALVTAADAAVARGLLGGTIIGSAVFTAPDEATAQAALDVPPNARTISAGTGLTGGGDLSADRTLALASVGSNQILANLTGSTAAPTGNSLSAILDTLSSVQGSIAYRGASGWTALAPGSVGQVLTTFGPGSDPAWATPNFVDDMAFSTLAMEVADLANQALFLGDSGNRIFDSFDTLTYVDVAGATNLDTSTPGELKPTLSSTQTFAISLNNDVSNGDMTHRMIVAASDLTTSGVQVRVRLSGPNGGSSRPINNAFIGHQASVGNPWDFDGNQVRLTFGGSNSVTPPVGGSVWSDWVSFNLDETKNLIVAHDGSVTGDIRCGIGVAGVTAYYKSGAAEADSTAPTGYTSQATTSYMLDQIEVRTGAGNNMTVASTILTAASVPTRGKITARIIAVDPVTLNTDLMMDVSRDGGTTWTQVTLAEKFTQPGSVKVIESNDIDISGQPSGVAPRWRIRTANYKMVKIPNMALYWK